MKIKGKFCAVILIWALFSAGIPVEGRTSSSACDRMVLAPRLTIMSAEVFEVMKKCSGGTPRSEAHAVKERRPDLAERIHDFFSRPYRKLETLLSFIIKGENAKKRIMIAALMISVNGFVDVYVVFPLKLAVIAASLLSGSPFNLIMAGLFTSLIGGVVRACYYPVFKIIWPDMLKLSKAAIVVNFIPWGMGNAAPALLVNQGTSIAAVIYVLQLKKAAKKIEESLRRHSSASDEQVKILEDYFEEMARLLCRHQIELQGYDFNRFKVLGAKDLSDKALLREIVREDLTDKRPFWFRIKQSLLAWIGVPTAGYRRGSRPVLLIDTQAELQRLKETLQATDVPYAYLRRIYVFDVTKAVRSRMGTTVDRFKIKAFLKRMFTERDLYERRKRDEAQTHPAVIPGAIISDGAVSESAVVYPAILRDPALGPANLSGFDSGSEVFASLSAAISI